MIKDFDVLGAEGVFLFYTLLRVLRQGISSSFSLALTIIDLEMVMRELLDPANLLGAQTLRVHEPAEVVIVSKHEDFMSRAL